MDHDDYRTRFDGIRRLYGDAAFAVLPELHLCVVGIGGVGSWAAEALARSGVGRISLIDHDDVCASNINRQIHALSDTVGRSKVEVMAQRVLQINPGCECRPIDDQLTAANLSRLLGDRPVGTEYDYVIDAIDSVKFKAAMIHHCRHNKIPIITTGGAGGLTDPTAIAVADLSRTWNDPLAAAVRSLLRSRHGFTRNPKRRFDVECVFSSEQPIYPKADGSVSTRKPGVHGLTLDCSLGYGAATQVTACFGLVAAARGLKKALARRLRVQAVEGIGKDVPGD